jgi:hypothetical protein
VQQEQKQMLPMFKALNGIVPSDLFIFNFLMFHHWLASQEGFSIRWLLVFRTCLSSDKNQL